MKQRQVGFTLIEMIILIVVLGILAVTVAPKFINIQNDARIAVVKAGAGAAASAAQIVYGKAAIQGKDLLEKSTVTTASGDVEIAYGYPTATSAGIGAAVIGFGTDFVPVSAEAPTALSGGAAAGAKSISYSLASLAVEPGTSQSSSTFADGEEPTATATCFFTYTEATVSAAASTAVTCPVDGAATEPGTPPTGGSDGAGRF
ncbi:MAG: type II secretion system protein [Vibrionaceae bacterium]